MGVHAHKPGLLCADFAYLTPHHTNNTSDSNRSTHTHSNGSVDPFLGPPGPTFGVFWRRSLTLKKWSENGPFLEVKDRRQNVPKCSKMGASGSPIGGCFASVTYRVSIYHLLSSPLSLLVSGSNVRSLCSFARTLLPLAPVCLFSPLAHRPDRLHDLQHLSNSLHCLPPSFPR